MLVENQKTSIFENIETPSDIQFEERFDSAQRKAKLLNNHLLLENGSEVAHVAYDDGKLSYALALINPDYLYFGVLNSDTDVNIANEKYNLINLKFISSHEFYHPQSNNRFDAIIASDIIYKIYNANGFIKNQINNFIIKLLEKLKIEGQLLIKDYAVPSPQDIVYLELPYYKSRQEDVEVFETFFKTSKTYKDITEEIESEKTYTRLFKTSYAGAYSFILGRDKPEISCAGTWQLSPYSADEYRTLIESLEGRVLYMNAHRDEAYIKQNFQERFHLFAEDRKNLGYPSTSFILLIQKQQQNESLYLFEKEKLDKAPSNLSITAVIDEMNGHLFEMVKNIDIQSDIIPYRITDEGRLNIFLTESTPHSIANTLMSKSHNLDNRQWSGHMIDAVKLEVEEVHIYKDQGEQEVRQLIYDTHRIVTACGSNFEKGPSLYPAPDYIDELRECYYISVCKNYNCSECLDVIRNSQAHSKSKPTLKELDAQKVLNAIRIGLIPSTILETQIIYLMQKLSIPIDKETEKNIPLDRAEPKRRLNKRELMSFLSNKTPRFKETRERTGKLDIVRSMFSDEGKVGNDLVDIASGEAEFISFNKQTTNTALVIPLTRDLGGEILAGFEAKFLPVPERFTGSSASIAAPTFPLPENITNYDLAKEYIAKQFKVTPDRVGKLGESYFTQIDMTPHRIYPFVVATAAYDREGWGGSGGEDGFTAYSPLEEIWKLIYWDNTKSFMTISARLMTRWCQDSDLSMGRKFNKSQLADKISKTINTREVSASSNSFVKQNEYNII